MERLDRAVADDDVGVEEAQKVARCGRRAGVERGRHSARLFVAHHADALEFPQHLRRRRAGAVVDDDQLCGARRAAHERVEAVLEENVIPEDGNDDGE